MRPSVLIASMLVLCGATSAGATPANEAAADAMFHEAQALFDSGHVFEACRKFERSMHTDPQLGRLLNVAFCHEAEGRPASALAEYEQAVAMAEVQGQKERAEFARSRAAAVRGKLAFVRLDLGDARPSEVWVDARPIAPDAWASPIPVDPGAHTVTVSVQGKAARVIAVDVPAQKEVHVPVELSDAGAIAAAGGRPWQATLGLVLGGAGIVALGAGVGLAATAAALREDANPHCPNGTCDPPGAEKMAQARIVTTLYAIGLVSGGALLATSALLLITAPTKRGAHARFVPAVGPTFAGAGFEASW